MTEHSISRRSRSNADLPAKSQADSSPEVEFFREIAMAGGGGGGIAAGVGGGGGQDLWKLLRDRLAGRWKFAIPLACALAMFLGAAGYLTSNVEYESTGVIRVVPNIVPLVRQTAETGVMPLYSNYIRTQASLVTSPRVLERAAQNLDLSKLPWEDQQSALRALRRVNARAEVNSELILVRFSAESPDAAQMVVNAVIRAYDDLYGSVQGDEITNRLQMLRTYRETLRSQQRTHRTRLDNFIAGTDYGVGDYTSLISEKASFIHQSELELRRVNVMLAAARLEMPEGGEDVNGYVDPQRLEAVDEELARLRRLRDEQRLYLEVMRDRRTAEHPARIAAEEQLRALERLYSQRLQMVEQTLLANGQLDLADPAKELEVRADRLRHEIEQEREATRRLTQAQQELNTMRTELRDVEQELSDTNARLRALEVEADAIRTGRIVIAAMGDRPVEPSRDRRRPFALLGAMVGFGAGMGLFFLLGTIDRRAYAVDQLSSSSAVRRVLGVLPALPRDNRDVDAAGVAAHCVHQVRNTVEAVRRPGGSLVIGISSPAPSDGKTSLATALAASYATAGVRTLLVDCDILGRSLTRQTELVGRRGLSDALSEGTTEGSVHGMPKGSLSVLPSGTLTAAEYGPEMIRKDDLTEVFSQLRTTFDIIIVDTGPIFGGIESLPVAAAVDGMIIVARRGCRQSMIERCIESLASVSATYIGLVLNFARGADCERYASRSKVSGELARRNGNSASKDGDVSLQQNVLLRAMNSSGQRPSAD